MSGMQSSDLNIKSGRLVEIEQRTVGKAVWAPDDAEPNASWPGWSFDRKELTAGADDMAVTVSLTHDVSRKAAPYVRQEIPTVRMMLSAILTTGASARAVTCGRHAFDLSEALTAEVKAMRESHGLKGRVHLFVAGPGGFPFYLGQRQPALGPTTLYEFDFEGTKELIRALALASHYLNFNPRIAPRTRRYCTSRTQPLWLVGA